MQQYLFRVLSALMTGLFLLVWVPVNLFLRHDLRLVASSFAFAAVFLAFTILARRRNVYLFRCYCVAHLLQTNLQWYLSAGSMGRQEMALFSLSFSAVLFLRGAWRVAYLIAVVIDGLILYESEMLWPGWTIAYHSAAQRLQDHALIFVVVVLGCAWAVQFIVQAYEREHEELVKAHQELQKTMAELRVLRGFLSTCAWCKRVREDDGKWVPMESYIQRHTHALLPMERVRSAQSFYKRKVVLRLPRRSFDQR